MAAHPSSTRPLIGMTGREHAISGVSGCWPRVVQTILGVQHDAPVDLAVDQGLIGVAHGSEWIRCGDGDVQVTGSGEGVDEGVNSIDRGEDPFLFAVAVLDRLDAIS